MSMIVITGRTCHNCGKPFTAHGLNQKYCDECSRNIRRKMMHRKLMVERPCLYCGKMFKPFRDAQHFCCKKHCGYYRKGRTTAVEAVKFCKHCGKSFRTKLGYKIYCSAECRQDAENIRVRKGEPLRCRICGKLIEDRKVGAMTCLACHTAEKASHWTLKECAMCGKEFKTNKSRKVCCSKECQRDRRTWLEKLRYAKRADKPAPPQEVRDKIRDIVAQFEDPYAAAQEQDTDMIYGNMVYL